MKLKQIMLIISLLTLSSACVGGSLRTVKLDGGARMGVGYIENRDTRFSPFAVKNFKNMLTFELNSRDYQVLEPEYAHLKKPKKKGKNPSKNSKTAQRDGFLREGVQLAGLEDKLLPKRLRNVAGEKRIRSQPPGILPQRRALKSKEIAILAKKQGLQYYVQGAVGRSESGTLLEVKVSTLIFLEIYNTQGRKVGAMSLDLKGGGLDESRVLKSICRRIARSFRSKFPGKH